MVKNEISSFKHISFVYKGDSVFLWNRFKPSVLVLEKDDFNYILKFIKKKNESNLKKKFDNSTLFLLKKSNILGKNNYSDNYLVEMDEFLKKKEENFINWFYKKKPLPLIQFVNEECNLYCNYCIARYTNQIPKNKNRKTNKNTVYSNIFRLLEFQYESMKKNNFKEFALSFNGGEPLLNFKLIKSIVEYVRIKKKDTFSRISLNTNGTLITNEIADFLKKYNFNVSVSVDLNKLHHNTTRIYKNGKGSYNNVINSIDILRNHGFTNNNLNTQGTISDFNLIKTEELIDFYKKNNFDSPRLSPNLLNENPQESELKAIKFFNLIKELNKVNILLHDDIFKQFKLALDKGINFIYWPLCHGLGGHDTRTGFMFNISGNSYSYLCSFFPKSFVKIGKQKNIHDIIFSKETISITINALKERINAIKKYCLDCPIIGICRGGCIMDGLTSFNKENKTGCVYRKTMWRLVLNYLNNDGKENTE